MTQHDPGAAAPAPGTSLYRTYRPRRFAELVGQRPIADALRSAAAENRIGHAYLFSGPRGTGKTSTARILAMAANCTQPAAGEPCGTCPSCRTIAGGHSFDVIEIDAATHTGVDAIRELISGAALASPGRRKVYIIDEVHQLSNAAASALLKTLEEPPPGVLFVLATTDPQRVLPTIRSRCQHLPFRLLDPVTMLDHLRTVAADAGLDVDDETLTRAVRRGAGSVRDALSALEAGAALGEGTDEPCDTVVAALVEADIAATLKAVAAAVAAGTEPRRLAEDTIALLRDLFLVQMGAGDLAANPDTGTRQAQAERLGPRNTVKALELLGEAVAAMRGDHDARVNLEVALVRYLKVAERGRSAA